MPSKGKGRSGGKLAAAMAKSNNNSTGKQTPWLWYFMLPVVLAFSVFLFGGFGDSDEFSLLDGDARELKQTAPWPEGEIWGGVDGSCNMAPWLQSEHPVAGQHLLCLERGADGVLDVTVRRQLMGGGAAANFTIAAPGGDVQSQTLSSIRAELQAGVGTRQSTAHLAPASFHRDQ